MNQSTQQTDATTDTGAPVVSVPRSAQHDPPKRQQALVAMGRRAVAPPELTVLLHDAAALAAETLDADYFSVAQISSRDGSLAMWLGTVKDEAEENHGVTVSVDRADASCLTAHVLQAACLAMVDDLPRDKRFHDPVLEKHGLRSAIVVPLLQQDGAFGALGVYSTQSHRFDEEDAMFVEMTVHLAATTVSHKRAENSLAAEHRQGDQLRQTVNAMVLKLDPQWRVQETNRACEQVTGFTLSELKGRDIWSVFPAANHEEEVRQVQKELSRGKSPVTYEGDLLTKHSQQRRIAWAYSATIADDGALESILATGIDVTESHEVLEKVERVLRASRNAGHSLAELGVTGGPDESGSGEFSRLPLPPNVERRGRPRRSYQYRQKVAEVVDGLLPKPSDFREVFCNDISAGGFSFLAENAPGSDTFVVALGIPPRVIYVTVQVAHITQIERDGNRMLLVGCEYIKRVGY